METDLLDPDIYTRQQDETTQVIFVKASTPVQGLATRIAVLIEEGWGHVVTRSMGAGSTNQAAKAWAVVCRRYLRDGRRLHRRRRRGAGD